MTIVVCQECNDAPAVTRRRFHGPETALYDLCQGCADHWDAVTDAIEADEPRALRPDSL